MKNCPTCNELLVFPRESYAYCEECGWPDEDFGGEYGYPTDGDRLEQFQPGLQFYNEKTGEWVPSGVITATFKECYDRGHYRYPIKAES